MKEIIRSLPKQIKAAVKLVPHTRPVKKQRWQRILVCGMGGSGISGDLLRVLYPKCDIVTNKDYTLPQYIDERTCAIVISYSGNTEETLHAFSELNKRRAHIIALSSNGQLLRKNTDMKIQVPGGLPPRGALGYLFAPLPIILYQYGFINTNPKKQLIACAHFLENRQLALEKKARSIAKQLKNKLTIIYGNSPLFFAAARRWQCQFNENAKVLCHVNELPEMNHNEIVGLGRPPALNKHSAVVFLNDTRAYQRNQRRVSILKRIIKPFMHTIIEIQPHGRNDIQRLFWTIMLGDYVSFFLATLCGIDPLPVKRIDYLKKELTK
jgi:glucose/mannose-6-phosphate isomerase